MDRLSHACAEYGLPLTHQKVVIYEKISKSKKHPTPEEVYKEVHKVLPSISKATVYKNINKFCEIGLMRVIETAGVMRIDPNTDAHHHLIDGKTGAISDVYITKDIPLPKGVRKSDIDKIVINYYLK